MMSAVVCATAHDSSNAFGFDELRLIANDGELRSR